MTTLTACSSRDSVPTPESIRQAGVLRVAAAVDSEYPYLYWDAAGQAAGIEADAVSAIAAALGVQAEFIPFTTNDVNAAVGEGLADIGIAGFEQGRTRGVAQTVSYYTRRTFILTRRGEAYPDADAMSGVRFLTTQRRYGNIAERVPNISDAVDRLTLERADAILTGEHEALAAVAASGERLQTDVYPGAYNRRLVAVTAFGTTELLEFINAEIRRLREAGLIHRAIEGE